MAISAWGPVPRSPGLGLAHLDRGRRGANSESVGESYSRATFRPVRAPGISTRRLHPRGTRGSRLDPAGPCRNHRPPCPDRQRDRQRQEGDHSPDGGCSGGCSGHVRRVLAQSSDCLPTGQCRTTRSGDRDSCPAASRLDQASPRDVNWHSKSVKGTVPSRFEVSLWHSGMPEDTDSARVAPVRARNPGQLAGSRSSRRRCRCRFRWARFLEWSSRQ